MRNLEEDERMLQVFLSRGLSEKAAQDILDCLDHIEEMKNDPFQSYVYTKEKINEESQNDLWSADTALDKMKNAYFLYKNSIFKEFAMIAYLDSLDSKHKSEHLEQILWADDYDSKAYGTVVETTTGYHFCNFNGYAQFPSGKYVYRVKNGVRSLLSYRKDENAWKVSAGDLVEVYDEPLEEIVEFTFFTKPVYAEANTATELLAKMLPDKGFITAEKKMKIDVEPDTNKATVTDIVKPVFDSNDDYRYTVNNNTLNDLQFVRKSIEDDKSCIAVSLYNQEKGEYLAVIYGYTHSGDLLLADMNTLKPIGTLKITESARKMLDENGDIVSVSYFEFNGFGFSSNNGDRISFFASSSKTQSTESQFKKDSKKNTNDKAKENNKDTSKSEGSEKESDGQQDRTDNASDFTDTLPSADTDSTDLDSTQSVVQ